MHDPICNHDHPDCFAKKNGKCVCLNDTKFGGGRDCPFYKSKEQFDRENAESLERQRRKGNGI